VYKMKYL